MRLAFHGGARSVTGSNYLLETKKARILVDCGLHQGSHYCEAHNFEPFPYDPKTIDAVFITHSHIDHIGRLPQLVRAGFRGTIYSTPPGKDAGELLLLDSEHVLRQEAEKHKRDPLYEMADVVHTAALWRKHPYHEGIEIGDIKVELVNAGHVLGSASIIVSAEGKRIAFSGDLGNNPPAFINGTEYLHDIDIALIEAVYGARVHENHDLRKETLQKLIIDTVQRGGVLMVPAFALERTQELLFELNDLIEGKHIPRIPVFLDSPLAIKLTAVYQKYSEDSLYFNQESIALIKHGDAIFNFPGLHFTLTTEESKSINDVPPPKMIIAGSGMSHAGRILHHEKRYLPDPKSTILFVGYQAQGSLGRRILDGTQLVRIIGEDVAVQCHMKAIGGYSAHADQPQLLKWVEALQPKLKKLFVVQGEDDQTFPFAEKVKETWGIDTYIPSHKESVIL